ncbi:MAG: NUDIX hydrolase [Phycisphaerae bacterium]|nr:NUDIX hydrolase [Phycisphaerae bacterium]
MNNENANLTVLGEGKYFDFVRLDNWEFLRPKAFTGVVLIIAITDDGKLVLIEQFRPPVATRCVEIPAGLVGDVPEHGEEDFVTAARRELLEETGYTADTMEVVFEGAPSPGSNNIVITFLLARGLKKVADGGGDESEDITVYEVPVDEVYDWLLERRDMGHNVDLKVFTGLFFANREMEQTSD